MSVEHYIACPKCMKAFWCGCDGFSGWQFLYGNQPHMKALGEFMYEHWYHGAALMNEQQIDTGEQWEMVDDHTADMHSTATAGEKP